MSTQIGFHTSTPIDHLRLEGENLPEAFQRDLDNALEWWRLATEEERLCVKGYVEDLQSHLHARWVAAVARFALLGFRYVALLDLLCLAFAMWH